jgi:hypothetical protein
MKMSTIAIRVNFRRRKTLGLSAVLALSIVTLLIVPAFAQLKPSYNLLQEKKKDPAVEAYRNYIDKEYNSTIKKIPEPKKKSSDPWGSVRSAEPSKK